MKILYLPPGGGKVTSRHIHGARHILAPCGVCPQCMINHTQENAVRMWCELKTTEHNTWFATFTYDQEHLPKNNSINKRDFQLFMKRLRQACPTKVRFFACGEYGDKTGRAHYHAILFNMDIPNLKKDGKTKDGHQLMKSDWLTKLWGKGKCNFSIINTKTPMNYCAKYVQKIPKTKKYKETWNLKNPGKEFPFQLSSRNPGLGHDYFTKWKENIYRIKGIKIPNETRMQHFTIPRYFDTLLKRYHPEEYETQMEERIQWRPLLSDLVNEDGRGGYDTLQRRNQKAKAKWVQIQQRNRTKGQI
jgi:hypothetical protein